ncbi:MAG: PIN domain-containing protein [Vicinamibacterales bacterium]
MTGKVFVDTNVLVYAHDLDAEEKRAIAEHVVRQLWVDRSGVLSTHVLYELYLKITTAIAAPVSGHDARDLVNAYRVWPVMAIELKDILAASTCAERYHLSFRDGMIVAAALKARADIILSEALPAGDAISGIEIRNPFV